MKKLFVKEPSFKALPENVLHSASQFQEKENCDL